MDEMCRMCGGNENANSFGLEVSYEEANLQIKMQTKG